MAKDEDRFCRITLIVNGILALVTIKLTVLSYFMGEDLATYLQTGSAALGIMTALVFYAVVAVGEVRTLLRLALVIHAVGLALGLPGLLG